jgi:hypothetical protein
MGAALTYARRYALFTLVGIAGEDDLDAPDLCDGSPSFSPSTVDRSFKPSDGQPARMPGNGGARGGPKGEVPVTLDPEQSAALREKLLTGLGNITSSDLAAAWAREALPAKNSLTATDAKLVEDAFERRLSVLPSSAAAPSNNESSEPQIEGPRVIAAPESTDPTRAQGRQEHPRGGCPAALSQPGAPALRRPTGVSGVRPQAIGSPPPRVYPAPCARPQGQR